MAAIKIGNYYITKNDPRFLLRKVAELLEENQKYKEVIDKAIEFLKGFHNYEKRFKWCEQDYIDTIEELERILKEVE